MNLNNFEVRPRRQTVEHFLKTETWATLSRDERTTLIHEVAGLPSDLVDAGRL
jgi:type I restriction enzyme R subunit